MRVLQSRGMARARWGDTARQGQETLRVYPWAAPPCSEKHGMEATCFFNVLASIRV